MRIKTKELAMTGILTAIAIIIPMIVPIKVIIPPFSATLASHLPLILAMFINPLAAAFVALGSAVGFLIALGPVVAARAAMHIVFVLAGAMMIRRNRNIFLVLLVTMVLHTLSDMAIVYLLFQFGVNLLKDNTMAVVQGVIAVGTSLHHIVDFALAMLVLSATAKATKDIFLPMAFGKKRDDA